MDYSEQNCEISEKLNKQNFLKICLQVTYPTDFCIISFFFTVGKSENIWIFKKESENHVKWDSRSFMHICGLFMLGVKFFKWKKF